MSNFRLLQTTPVGSRPAPETARPSFARGWRYRRSLAAAIAFGFWLLWTVTSAKATQPPAITYTGTTLTQFTSFGAPLSPTGLNNPNGLALDLSGNVYIADTTNNRIVEIPLGGTTASLFAITGLGATPLSSPRQLAVDSAGNLYIADSGHNQIVKVPTTGSQAGMGTALTTGSIVLSGPQGVAVDTAGNVFIADTGNTQIVEIPAQGSPTVLISNGATPGGSALTSPVSLATDPSNNLYILDVATGPHTGRLIEVAPLSSLAGTLVTFSSALTDKAQGITVSNNGTIYVTDIPSTIYVNAQGNEYTLFDNLNSFDQPVAIATDSKGAFYILDNATAAVDFIHDASADFGHVLSGMSGAALQLNFAVSSSASISSFASSTTDFVTGSHTCSNGTTNTTCSVDLVFSPQVPGLRRGALVIHWASVPPGTTGTFTVPLFGIGDGPVAALSPVTTAFSASTLSAGGTQALQGPYQETFDESRSWLYITDTTLHEVFRLGSPSFGFVVPVSPNLTAPTGLVIDGAGNLFIADAPNIVEVLNPTGAPTNQTVNLNGFTLSSNVQSLAIDGSGNLIVDDAGNHRIVQLTPAHDGDGTLSSVYASVLASTTTSAGGISYAGGTSAAVDNGEALYISDNTNNRVIEVDRLGTATVVNFSSLSPALATPHSVTVDSMGNLYVVDAGGTSGAQRISLFTTAGHASVMPVTGVTLGSGTNQLTTVSPTPNVDYCGFMVADGTPGSAQHVCLSPEFGALTFGSVPVGGTSTSPMTARVTNLGDQDLVLTSVSFPTDFPQNLSDSNSCLLSTYQSPGLPAGMSCDVSVEFTPTTVGSKSESVSVVDNSQVPPSPQSISVTGTSIRIPTTTAVTFLPTSPVYGQSVTVTATVSAASTPTGTVTFTDQTTSTTLQSGVSLTSGAASVNVSSLGVESHTIQAVYTPTGSFATSNGSSAVTIAKANTSTALMLSGTTLTATVTVVAPGAGTPTGSVQFLNGSTVVGSETLGGGIATATVTVPATYTYTAVYSGDSNFTGSTSPAVSKTTVPTTTTVAFAPASSVYGQSVSVTATVSATFGTATGTVTFTDQTASTTLASNVSVTSGAATINVSTLGAGSHVIQAVYTPTGSYLTSSGNNTVTITKDSASTALTLSGNTLTVTVTAVAPGAGTPTGSVQFLNGSTVIGNGTLSGGTATLALTIPPPYSLSAVYAGDADFSTSTSQAVVGYAPGTTSLTLTSSPNPAQLGQPVTFTVIVTAHGGPPSAAPTGSVQFSDGTKVLGSSGLSNGQATYTTTALAAGTQIITATYGGDATFAASSATMGLMVSAPITMNITAAPSAPVYGQPVTLTVTVGATSVPAGLSAPTGQVTFFLEGITPASPSTKLGTAALASGGATLSLSTLSAGTVYIQGQYSGDSTWPPAYHQIELTISRAATTTSVSVAMSAGQLVLTGAVAPQSPGAGTPTGSVQFVDTSNNNAIVASAGLSGGTATAQVSAGTVSAMAGHAIAAVYAGDANFSPSTSAPLPAVASSAANVSVTVAPDEIASLYGIPGLNGRVTGTLPLGTSLDGVSVNITDSTGTTRPALLYAVSGAGGQINLVIPSGTATGPAVVSITLPAGAVVTAVINVVNIAPAVYTVSDTGQGTYSGQVTYVHADGTQTVVQSATDAGSNSFTPNPINLGTPGDQVYLTLYATGLRHGGSVTATVNGMSVPVAFFGAQPSNPGVDQINLGPLLSSLASAGQANIVIAVDGQAANTVTVTIQ